MWKFNRFLQATEHRPFYFGDTMGKWTKKTYVGELHHSWKGGNVKYAGLHTWVINTLGKPSSCSNCGTTTANSYEWANVSGEYKRETSDYIRLCAKCHRRFDNNPICPENTFGAKITKEQVVKIREIYEAKIMLKKDLAKMFHLGPRAIYSIVHRQSWKHV